MIRYREQGHNNSASYCRSKPSRTANVDNGISRT